MVDIGASQSTINTVPANSGGFGGSDSLIGFGGHTTVNRLLRPLPVTLGTQTVTHSFVFSPQCPVNLFGRDLLCQFCPLIKVTPAGLLLILPDGTKVTCSSRHTELEGLYPTWTDEDTTSVQELMTAALPMADIYWA